MATSEYKSFYKTVGGNEGSLCHLRQNIPKGGGINADNTEFYHEEPKISETGIL